MDTGFAAIGANGWFSVEYRNFSAKETAKGWKLLSSCSVLSGIPLSAQPCARNGLVREDQSWNLLPSFQLQHTPSGLCASASEEGPVILAVCNSTNIWDRQLFVNDYTRIRNKETSVTVSSVNKPLIGNKEGSVMVGHTGGDWKTWSYFPNTQQLRNQYTTQINL